MPTAVAVPLATAAIGGAAQIASAGKGKPTQYTQGLSPNQQKVDSIYSSKLQQGLNSPNPYAGVNMAQTTALDTIMRMFFGKGYQSPGASYYNPGQQDNSGFGAYGMPQQMGRQMPPGMPGQGGSQQDYNIWRQLQQMGGPSSPGFTTGGMRPQAMPMGPMGNGGMPGMMGGRPQQMGPQMPGGPFRGYYGR